MNAIAPAGRGDVLANHLGVIDLREGVLVGALLCAAVVGCGAVDTNEVDGGEGSDGGTTADGPELPTPDAAAPPTIREVRMGHSGATVQAPGANPVVFAKIPPT